MGYLLSLPLAPCERGNIHDIFDAKIVISHSICSAVKQQQQQCDDIHSPTENTERTSYSKLFFYNYTQDKRKKAHTLKRFANASQLMK